MKKRPPLLDRLHDSFLSEKVKKKGEKVIIWIAIVSFFTHLAAIFLVDMGWIEVGRENSLLQNPIAAIYTPFSFILVYEVYLLVYYLPRSTTSYIGKQYEIITLIVIRRIFKDISNLELTSNWFQIADDLQFSVDLVATLGLFFLIYLFYRLRLQKEKLKQAQRESSQEGEYSRPPGLNQFIRQKKTIATLLVPIFLGLALFTFGKWMYEHVLSVGELVYIVKDVNKVFYDEFFTVLILTDVLLLLLSFLHTDQFSTVVRNSGFIISTILIRTSFRVEGILNPILILVAVVFGVLILYIHNRYHHFGVTHDI